MQVGIGTLPIVYFGTEEQKLRYLPKLASGEWVSSYSLSEASSASDAMNAKARAVLSEDGKSWILNGEKMWLSNAGFADLYITFVITSYSIHYTKLYERRWSGPPPRPPRRWSRPGPRTRRPPPRPRRPR